jgi:hypothetical protein
MKTINNKTTIITSITIATLLFAGSSFLVGQNAYAVAIPISLPSFESPELNDFQWTPNGNGGGSNPTEWTFGNGAGVFNPTSVNHLTSEAYDGDNTAYSNGGTICQELGAITGNTFYELSVWVGDRKDTAFPGYDIELRDASDDSILASVDETTGNPPADDDWAENTLELTILDDASIGNNLKICLSSDGVQTNFDDVSLEATPIIEIEKEFADTDLLPLPDFLPVKSEVGPTMLWFNLTYAGPLANVTDTVPAEWEIVAFTGPSADDCTHETSNKKNNDKSSTQINCEDQTNVDLTVKLSTRESPSNGKGNPDKLDKWKPTSCGTVYANDGAYAFTLENGVFTLVDNVGPLWLTAAEDNIDGLSNCDGDTLLDFEDACPDVFDDGTDTDSDGVPDACDNAPNDENPRQADFDKDGVGDVVDNCFFVPNADQTDTDSNGVGDACNSSEDADGDEWADGLDNCPADANPGQEDNYGTSLGDACEDTDGDGANDDVDVCPTDPLDLCV